MANELKWVMAGTVDGDLTAQGAMLAQSLILASMPGEISSGRIQAVQDIAGVESWAGLETLLMSLSRVSVGLVAAPEGWMCAGSCLLEWSVSGDTVSWRVSKHVHSAFADDDAPSLPALLPFVRAKGRRSVRAMRLFDILHRAAKRGGEIALPAEHAMRLLDLEGMSLADARRYGTDKAMEDVVTFAPQISSPNIVFDRDWLTPGGPIRTVTFKAGLRAAEPIAGMGPLPRFGGWKQAS